MRLRLHPDAAAEIQREAEYYEGKALGLGVAFLDEMDATVERIRIAPDACPPRDGRVRIAVMSRFPFSLLYRTHDDVLDILVVRHHARRADYGRERL